MDLQSLKGSDIWLFVIISAVGSTSNNVIHLRYPSPNPNRLKISKIYPHSILSNALSAPNDRTALPLVFYLRHNTFSSLSNVLSNASLPWCLMTIKILDGMTLFVKGIFLALAEEKSLQSLKTEVISAFHRIH